MHVLEEPIVYNLVQNPNKHTHTYELLIFYCIVLYCIVIQWASKIWATNQKTTANETTMFEISGSFGATFSRAHCMHELCLSFLHNTGAFVCVYVFQLLFIWCKYNWLTLAPSHTHTQTKHNTRINNQFPWHLTHALIFPTLKWAIFIYLFLLVNVIFLFMIISYLVCWNWKVGGEGRANVVQCIT